MLGSPNMYTEPMSVHEGPRSSFWVKADAQLVAEELRQPERPVGAPYEHPDTKLAHELMFGRISIEQALNAPE